MYRRTSAGMEGQPRDEKDTDKPGTVDELEGDTDDGDDEGPDMTKCRSQTGVPNSLCVEAATSLFHHIPTFLASDPDRFARRTPLRPPARKNDIYVVTNRPRQVFYKRAIDLLFKEKYRVSFPTWCCVLRNK